MDETSSLAVTTENSVVHEVTGTPVVLSVGNSSVVPDPVSDLTAEDATAQSVNVANWVSQRQTVRPIEYARLEWKYEPQQRSQILRCGMNLNPVYVEPRKFWQCSKCNMEAEFRCNYKYEDGRCLVCLCVKCCAGMFDWKDNFRSQPFLAYCYTHPHVPNPNNLPLFTFQFSRELITDRKTAKLYQTKKQVLIVFEGDRRDESKNGYIDEIVQSSINRHGGIIPILAQFSRRSAYSKQIDLVASQMHQLYSKYDRSDIQRMLIFFDINVGEECPGFRSTIIPKSTISCPLQSTFDMFFKEMDPIMHCAKDHKTLLVFSGATAHSPESILMRGMECVSLQPRNTASVSRALPKGVLSTTT
jgi:hypothetical protein